MHVVCDQPKSHQSAIKPFDSSMRQLEPPTDEFDDYPPYEHSNVLVTFGLDDRYEYIDQADSCVGHGSFGTVFKGVDHEKECSVAIKKMDTSHVKPHELKAMQNIRSAYLVNVFDICASLDGITHVVMELMDSDLDHHLQWNACDGKLVGEELDTVVNNVTQGYAALFNQKIVHRDIKPHNILITYDPVTKVINKAKITDFGVSRMLLNDDDEEQLLSNVAGTLYYMAPEVGANLLTLREYDHSVDMWSLGCVFYQILVGEVPFNEACLCRLFLNCAGHNFEGYDMPDLPEDCPENLRTIISGLLEIDRKKRTTPKQLFEQVCIPTTSSEDDE